MKSKVLVTGGAGYIGSHTVLALLQSGIEVLVLDNLCNSSPESLSRVARISGHSPVFVHGDVRDGWLLNRLFADHSIYAVLHFAGLKAVGESVSQPLRYYDNNVHGSQVLLQACADAGVFNVVFSSSATVYGELAQMPISEACPTGQTINPYGRSKLMVEHMLRDVAASDPRWRIAILRYFNPVGAHESGLIGEDPSGVPNNLMPYIAQVAVGKLPELGVFGNDYPTPDGTGVRDYIHVVDLAEILRSRPDVGFLFVGRGSASGRLKAAAQARHLDNVIFFDEIDPDEIPDLYAQCDAGIVALDPRHKSHNIPGKFLTYMQSGLPVLANINAGNDLAQMIRNECVGQVCETNQVDELLLLTEKLLDQIETDSGLSARCTALFEREFAVENTVKQIVAGLSATEAGRP